MSRMNHDYIAEQDFVGRYMAGTLPSDERATFEAHFVDCPRCLDALEDVEPFENALSAFAAEKTALVPIAAALAPVTTTAQRLDSASGLDGASAKMAGVCVSCCGARCGRRHRRRRRRGVRAHATGTCSGGCGGRDLRATAGRIRSAHSRAERAERPTHRATRDIGAIRRVGLSTREGSRCCV